MISIIACIGKNRELGLNNQLIFHIKEDLRFFKSTTLGRPVIMGRATFDSIGRPLPGRTNLVVTHHPSSLPSGVTPVLSLQQQLESAYASPEEFFVIGGASLYAAALPLAHRLYLTEVAATAPADTFFPAFDPSRYHKTIIKKGLQDDLAYQFVKYTLI